MLYVIICVLVLITIGLIKNIDILIKYNREYNFTNEYHNVFINFFNDLIKNKFNNEQYIWLVSNADKMQSILGSMGLISYTQFNMLYKNIPIILNCFDNVLFMTNEIFLNNYSNRFIERSQIALLRKKGNLEEQIRKIKVQFFNPIFHLSIGIKAILIIPINILYTVDIISDVDKNNAISSSFFRFLSGVVTILTIISLFLGIVIDFPTFINALKSIINMN